jgi:hypothetical protein
VLKQLKHYQSFLGCLHSSKSISPRELIPQTCIQIKFDLSYLIRPNRPGLIDPRQPTQGEKKGQASSSGSIDKSLYTQKHHG